MQANYSEPSHRLTTLWLEWIGLHRMLEKALKAEITAPFFSSAASDHPDDCVLLVGKATARDYWGDDYRKSLRKSEKEAMRDRLMRNREIVSSGYSGSFWRLFNQVAELRPDMGRDGVIWSNVAKIGTKTGNPTGLLLSAQGDLARRTLVEEVREYKPLLVIFVNGNYAEQIVLDAFGWFKKDDRWKDCDAEGNVSWCSGSQEFPKVQFLWVRHPQGKTAEHISFCCQKAWELIMT